MGVRCLVFAAVLGCSAAAFSQERICGSFDQYKASILDWKTLPGCTGDQNGADISRAGMSRAKEACGRVAETFDSNQPAIKVDDAYKELGDRCRGRTDDGSRAADWTKSHSPDAKAYEVYGNLVLDKFKDAAYYAENAVKYFNAAQSATSLSARRSALDSLREALSGSVDKEIPREWMDLRMAPLHVEEVRESYKTMWKAYKDDVSAQEGKNNAHWDEVRKTLSGDRLYYFDVANLGQAYIYGPGGVRLTTPEQIAKSPALYKCVLQRTNNNLTWVVYGHHFQGPKSIPYTATGAGGDCPTSAYK